MAKTNQAITIFLHICLLLLLLLSSTTSHPLCSDSSKSHVVLSSIVVVFMSFWVFVFFWSETQVNTNQTLEFCDSYSGKTCCNSKDDLELQNRFNSMNISDSNCSSLLKSILCAVSIDLFTCPFSWIQDSLFQILQLFDLFWFWISWVYSPEMWSILWTTVW